MAGDNDHELHDRLSTLLSSLARISAAVGSIVAGGTAQLFAIQRHEMQRIAAMFALTLAAALFACAAAGFAAYSIMAALGEEHRVVGSALIAGCFALLSGICILLSRARPTSS